MIAAAALRSRVPAPAALLAALLVLAMTPCAAVTVDVDGRAFEVPAPDGFEEVASLSRDVRRLAETITPPDNRLLAAFLPDEQVEQVLAGQAPTWRRYMLVQVERERESVSVSASDFAELKRRLRTQQEALAARSSVAPEDLLRDDDAAAADRGATKGIRVDAMLPVGLIDEGENHVSIATLTRYRVHGDSATRIKVVAAGTNLLRLDDRLVLAYVYATFAGDADLDWVEDTSRRWAAAIVAANRDAAGAAPALASRQGMLLAGAGGAVLVAAIAIW
ncbi:MAG: hypothetical protein R3286_13670, partial [Gammaproteobacteria bacterium]|nr:hypothetical protein [Gammaproteobacteria bacterium]